MIDFLWEWGEGHGDWAKLLICKVVAAEAPLSDADREEVFNYFLSTINLKTGLAALTLSKPNYTPPVQRLELVSLSDVQGVNRLANDQTMTFGKNVTVVYGANGSGKTGYGRILHALGFSYQNSLQIHCDVFKNNTPQRAKIKYEVDGVEQEFDWDGRSSNDSLKTISVFNNHCVEISLGRGRNLLVSPLGFHLFQLVTDELNLLDAMLNATKETYPITLDWADRLTLGTQQQVFVSTLRHNSDLKKLTEISEWTPAHETELAELGERLKNLNKALLQAELRDFQNQATEIGQIIEKLERIQTALSEDACQKNCAVRNRVTALQGKTKQSLEAAASAHGIALFESSAFKNFITAAETYLNALRNERYPNEEGERCIYCQQELQDDKAKALLTAYRAVLADDTERQLKEARTELEKLKAVIDALDGVFTIHHGSFGKQENGTSVQPPLLTAIQEKVAQTKQQLATGVVGESADLTVNCADCLDTLNALLADRNSRLQEKRDLISNLTTTEDKLKAEIAALQDRKLLYDKRAEVFTCIANRGIQNQLHAKRNTFNTNSLSRKTTEAREELMRQNFTDLFQKELKALRKHHIPVELNFGTERGKSKLNQTLAEEFSLAEVLSEGEQKAIALAEFLTELQLDRSQAPVVFDDPVNSLDEKMIGDVAKRLLQLSRQRQVVIFTHSVLLYNAMLAYLLEQNIEGFHQLDYSLYDVEAETDQTGFLTASLQGRNSVDYYTKRINELTGSKPANVRESEAAASAYSFLRSAIELLVEKVILCDTVKRYRKNVALTSFARINANLIEQHRPKLNEIFERCCAYLDGHSNPEQVASEPTMQELKDDYAEFLAIKKAFAAKPEKQHTAS